MSNSHDRHINIVGFDKNQNKLVIYGTIIICQQLWGI